MPRFLKSIYELVKQTVSEWIDQDVSRMGAALAFNTIFAIAPLFVIVLAIAGFVFGEQAASRELFSQVSDLVGSEVGETIQALVSAAHKPKTGAWATVITVATLFVGATGVSVRLQDALNAIWGVRRLPGRGLRNFIKDRLLSFALIVGIGFASEGRVNDRAPAAPPYRQKTIASILDRLRSYPLDDLRSRLSSKGPSVH